MSVLICGSVAYDVLLRYEGHFNRDILRDKMEHLNVAFLTTNMRREFGGCAGNIAYSLGLLGVEAYPMATVGQDFRDYEEWMTQNEMLQSRILILEDEFTPQAFITTDLDDNQITIFHPGAMDRCHEQAVDAEGIQLGLVSPEGRIGMVQHAQQMAEAGIPFLFDPGQGMPMFEAEEFATFVEQATWAAFNAYEAEMMEARSGMTVAQLTQRLEAIIITHGRDGSEIHLAGGKVLSIPVLEVAHDVDPTGCGDAYRAGLLYGILHDMDWETSGRIGALLGAEKVQHLGGQNHTLDVDHMEVRFREAFGYSLQ